MATSLTSGNDECASSQIRSQVRDMDTNGTGCRWAVAHVTYFLLPAVVSRCSRTHTQVSSRGGASRGDALLPVRISSVCYANPDGWR